MSSSKLIPYVEFGHGEVPVVLLHGLFGDPENWRAIMEDLSGRYRFLAPQFPIDQFSGFRPSDFRSIGQLTDFVSLFFDQMGLDKAVLVGNSLGGQVAVDFYLAYPGRVSGLVLTGSAGLFENAISGGELPKVEHGYIRQRAREIFYDESFVTDDLVERIHGMLSDRTYVRLLIRIAKASRDRNIRDELCQVKTPTLIVWGRNDQITPPFVAEEFRDGIENSQLVFIDRCGHSPPMEQPLQFGRVLGEFLKDPVPAYPHGG